MQRMYETHLQSTPRRSLNSVYRLLGTLDKSSTKEIDFDGASVRLLEAAAGRICGLEFDGCQGEQRIRTARSCEATAMNALAYPHEFGEMA